MPSVFLHPRGSLELGGARLATPCGARMISPLSYMLSATLHARTLTILIPDIGAAFGFGHGTRTHTLSRGTLAGREASKCAVRQMPKASETDRLT